MSKVLFPDEKKLQQFLEYLLSESDSRKLPVACTVRYGSNGALTRELVEFANGPRIHELNHHVTKADYAFKFSYLPGWGYHPPLCKWLTSPDPVLGELDEPGATIWFSEHPCGIKPPHRDPTELIIVLPPLQW